ncbi:hypothetical protein [Mumia zhuanghuii]|uniref:hypothetical protein n=1 Tax=Mumia zhuanghuii TaxID=2585211 RepID=UPI00129C1C17|nr:hypothetical protein [Mumia zhuanghuii]
MRLELEDRPLTEAAPWTLRELGRLERRHESPECMLSASGLPLPGGAKGVPSRR